MALVLLAHYIVLLLLLPWIPSYMRSGAVFFVLGLVAFETVLLRLVWNRPTGEGESTANLLLFGTCASAVAVGLVLFDLGNQFAGVAVMAGAILTFGVGGRLIK